MVHDTNDMLNIATHFYRDLFKYEENANVSLLQDFFNEDEKVTDEENAKLEAPFTEEEVKKVVFGSYSGGGPGPDLSFMFYQHFWEIIKGDLLAMFHELEKDDLDLYRLNFPMITLIPKENDARIMSKFRHISLLNCCFKIFTKVLTNRLAMIIDWLIANSQSAFIKCRYILESVVTC